MRFRILLIMLSALTISAPSFAAPALPAATAKVKAANAKASKQGAVSSSDLSLLKKLDAIYQHQIARMNVDKVTKIPLLDQERKSSGTLFLSGGRLRMEMQGTEKTLLVVNKRNLWAVTYPPAEFKDAALQVIEADTGTKKGRSHSFMTLLSQGGFLKFFIATGSLKQDNGDVLFFLTPIEEQVDFKRAQVKVSADGKRLVALSYWDDRDNETRMEFKNYQSESKLDDKLFTYTPPANADVMKL